MGIFGKLFGALKKTKDNFSGKLRMLFSKNKLGDEFYEELEEILISSDVSVAAAEEVVERVKAQAIDEKLKDEEYVTELLRGILTDILEEAEVPDVSYPCVIMLVGVNGVGKTTTIGKLARYFLDQGKSVTVAAADTFRAAASEQLSVCASSNTRRGAIPRRLFSTRCLPPRPSARTWSSSIRRGASMSKTI